MVNRDFAAGVVITGLLGLGVVSYVSQKDFGDLTSLEDSLRQGGIDEQRGDCTLYTPRIVGGKSVAFEECHLTDADSPTTRRLWVTDTSGTCEDSEYVLQALRRGPYFLRGPNNSALAPFGTTFTCYTNSAVELISSFRDQE